MTNEEAIKELSVLWERMKRAKESGVLAYKTIMFYDGQYVEALDLAIKALEQTRWIPVSERLPEDYIHVLCQFTLGGMGECYLAHGVFHVVGGLVMTCNEVIAWMPLPQPYKTESESDVQ